jgi:hypothetical protein
MVDLPFIREIVWDNSPKELSVREKARGGAVATAAIQSPPNLLKRSRRIVLLIHGFDVDFDSAKLAYARFVRHIPLHTSARTIWIYWPGDQTNEIWSSVGYSLKPEVAEHSAHVIEEAISEAVRWRYPRYQPLEVSIVAHSLGCRLALELLNRITSLSGAGSLKLTFVVLMAAAVPQFLLKAGGRFDVTKLKVARLLNFFSKDDGVLKWAFRLGQFWESTANPVTWFLDRGAVGRHGLPSPVGENVEQFEGVRGHGDYWTDRGIAWTVNDRFSDERRRIYRRLIVPRSLGFGRSIEPRSIGGRMPLLRAA